ncbi:MAG TPA: ribbon-helix-helix domain-containing protein [Candidatus Nanoarchaeia archaeon]|nr:ribbon-helix-helix domain-containing protein [Candidatus Nanoarchaeia archaeon]
MKLMTFKLSESLLDALDKATEDFHFASRTEFIRAAIRDKIDHCHEKRAQHGYPQSHTPEKKNMEYTG